MQAFRVTCTTGGGFNCRFNGSQSGAQNGARTTVGGREAIARILEAGLFCQPSFRFAPLKLGLLLPLSEKTIYY